MKFMLTLVIIGLLVFFSYYMFIAEEFKGSPKTQVKQALGIKDREDPAIEMEVNEIAVKYNLTDERAATLRQFIKMELKSQKQKVIAVLEDKGLTEQQKSERIMQIQKKSYIKISSYCDLDMQKRKEIIKWLMSRKSNKIDSNSH